MALKKKSKNLLTYGLTSTAMFGLFSLAFVGLYAIHPLFGLAITLGFLAAIIEGEVYKQNIKQAFKKLTKRDYTKRKIILKFLSKEMKNDLKLNSDDTRHFYADYQAQKDYIKQLKQQQPRDKVKLQQAKKRMRMMEDYFIDFVYERQDPQLQKSEYYSELASHFSAKQRQNLRIEVTTKLWLTRVGGFLSALGGVACAFVFAHAIHFTLFASLGAIGLGASAAGGPITIAAYILAVAAASAYSLMIYSTISDMIRNNTLRKWAVKVKNQFKRKIIIVDNDGEEPDKTQRFYKVRKYLNKIRFTEDGEQRKERLAVYLVRLTTYGILLTTVIGISLFATIATAGTWWYATKAGATMIPLLVKAGVWIRNVAVPAYVTTEFLFNIKNSLETFNQLTKVSVKNAFRATWNNLKATKAEENWLQFCNPFRIAIKVISMPMKILIFIGHIIGQGVTGDILHPFPSALNAGINSADELFQDAHYIFSLDGHQHAHECHHEHGHTHSDIPGAFIKFCLSPVYLLSSVWDYGFGYLPSRDEDARKCYHRNLSQSVKRSFNIDWPKLFTSITDLGSNIKRKFKSLVPERLKTRLAKQSADEDSSKAMTTIAEPRLSNAWCRTETYQRVNAEIKRLQQGVNPLKTSSKDKVTVLKKITTDIIKQSQHSDDETTLSSTTSATASAYSSSDSESVCSSSDTEPSTEFDDDDHKLKMMTDKTDSGVAQQIQDDDNGEIIVAQDASDLLADNDLLILQKHRSRIGLFEKSSAKTISTLNQIQKETGIAIIKETTTSTLPAAL